MSKLGKAKVKQTSAPAAQAAAPDVAAQAAALVQAVTDAGQAHEAGAVLLAALAPIFAAAPHNSLATAQAGLVAALAEAQVLAQLAQLTAGGSDSLTTLLRQLAELNAQGQPGEAGAALDGALQALPAGPSAARSALGEIAARQDRIRHRPDLAAQRLLAELRATPQPGGLFRAMHDHWEAWFDRGQEGALTFDLTVALQLARANAERAKGVQHTQALADLAITQFRLGEREGRAERLRAAVTSFRAVLAGLNRKTDAEAWAGAMVNLGIALATLAAMEVGTARLEEAVKCHRAALQVQTRARHPEDHAATSGFLAQALIALAERNSDAALAREALALLADCNGAADQITAAQTLLARLS